MAQLARRQISTCDRRNAMLVIGSGPLCRIGTHAIDAWVAELTRSG